MQLLGNCPALRKHPDLAAEGKQAGLAGDCSTFSDQMGTTSREEWVQSWGEEMGTRRPHFSNTG